MTTFRRDPQGKGNNNWRPLWVVLLVSHLIVYLWATGGNVFGSVPIDNSSSALLSIQSPDYHNLNNPLSIPQGIAVPLPSIPTNEDYGRKQYGGRGDKKHLGGFTDIDTEGISPRSWKWMISRLNIQSIIDVGCGRGISTTWFLTHGVDALCVEGSSDALSQTMLPDPPTQMVQHDFSRGPWWPRKTYDAVWCVEFLEHVGRNFHHNYLPVFRKAGLIFVSHSIWGGWHHVETHTDSWWKTKMEFYGFRYSEDLTRSIRTIAWNETRAFDTKGVAPNGKPIGAPHIHGRMLVFWNPAVTSLPQHAHLYYEPGCFVERVNDHNLTLRDCGEGEEGKLETPLPEQYKPLKLTAEQDKEWFEWVKARVKPWKDPKQ